VMRKGGWGVAPGLSGLKGSLTKGVRASRPLIRNTRVEPMLKRVWRTTKSALGVPDSGPAGPYALRDFHGVTVGSVGWSSNARAFLQLLCPFKATVEVFSEHAARDDIAAAGAHAAPLDEVLKADIVSLHRGLTAKTRHCLGAAELALLRPGAVFVNIARGGLVDEHALIARLRRGDVFACLDTFEQEPLPRRHVLRRLPNVFLTSHLAGGTLDMHKAASREIVAKVMAYLRGETVKIISHDQWRTMT